MEKVKKKNSEPKIIPVKELIELDIQSSEPTLQKCSCHLQCNRRINALQTEMLFIMCTKNFIPWKCLK